MYREIDREFAADLLNLEHAGFVCLFVKLDSPGCFSYFNVSQTIHLKGKMIREKYSLKKIFPSFPGNEISKQWALCLPLSIELNPRTFPWGDTVCVTTR